MGGIQRMRGTKGSQKIFRPILVALLYTAGAATLAWGQDSAPTPFQKRVTFDIAAQPLSAALRALGEQSGLTVAIDSDLGARSCPGVHGAYTVAAALRLLLPPELHATYLDSTTVAVVPNNQAEATHQTPGKPSGQASPKSADTSLRLAQDTQSAPHTDSPVNDSGQGLGPGSAARAVELEEVIVTAEKRSERLQDVPVPVTAISADTLLNRNEFRLQDYFSTVPGLSYLPGLRGESLLVIRGITTDPYTNPTVSITVDDVPYGSTTVNGGGNSPPDIDPSDLARVEVLRGPQGTLYGASSIGGLLKFVTVDPSTAGFSGQIQGSGSGVHNGEGAGYSVRSALNLPITDTWAARASAFARRDPGYVDDIQSGIDGVNRTNAYGGRVSTLWRPNAAFSMKLGVYLQDTEQHGSPDIDPTAGLGDLQQRRLEGTGTYDRKSEVFSANLTQNLGAVHITSLTGYTIDKLNALRDYTIPPFVGLARSAYGVGGAELLDDRRTTKFSQELRFSGSITPHFDWLAGGFFTNEHAPFVEALSAVNPATAVPMGSILIISFPSTYKEFAGFADLTYHFTDRFDVQLGGRESHDKQTLVQTQTLLGKVAAIHGGSSENAFTYLVTPRYRVSSDLMLYARLASGFRPGGINAIGGTPTVPLTYGPDKTLNYEVGTKGAVLNHLLTFDASLYYIDWKGIQLSLMQNGLGYRDNGGRARSRGAELSLEARPLRGMLMAAWVAWNDAELTQSFPVTSTVFGRDGDRLPNSSKFSANFSLDQDFPLVADWSGFVGGSVSYVGNRVGVFTATAAQRQYFPAYAKTDLRLGARYETWTVNAFINNVSDERGIFTGNLLGTQPFIDYIQPRTAGLSVTKTF